MDYNSNQNDKTVDFPMNDYYSLYEPYVKGIKQTGTNQYTGRCPFHKPDLNPSFFFEDIKGLSHCKAGCGGWNPYTFCKAIGIDPKLHINSTSPQSQNTPIHVPNFPRNGDVREYRDQELSKTDKEKAMHYHKYLVDSFDELTAGLPWTLEVVRKTFCGYSTKAKCFTYVTTNAEGKALALYHHKPDSNWGGKHQVGNAKSRFFAMHLVKDYDPNIPIILVEGQPDFLAAYSQGLQPITGTGGVASYKNLDYSRFTKFKELHIVLDNDTPGINESVKVAGKIKSDLPNVKIRVHTWKDKPDKYDISDFFNDGGNTDSFKELIKPDFRDFPVFQGVRIDKNLLTSATASYLNLASETTDAPDEYILMALISYWAGLVGYKIKFGDLRPNLWAVLFGKSSEIRKSTAFRVGGKVFKNIQSKFDNGYDEEIVLYQSKLREWEALPKNEKSETPKPEVPSHVKLILDADFSDAGFYEMLKNNPLAGTIVTAEFADFNTKIKRDYTNQSNALLSAYDGDRMSRITRTHGTEIIGNPAFSILGATTIGNFKKVFTATEAENGFLQRIFPVVLLEPTKRRKLYLEIKTMERGTLRLFEEMAMNWFRYDGEIEAVLTDEIKRLFNRWEERFIAESKANHGTDISPNLERMIPGCLKLAMLLESMEKDSPPETLIISRRSLECSQMIVQKMFLPSLVYLMENEIIFDRNQYDEKRIEKALLEAGGFIDRTELMRTTRMNKKRLDEVMDTMIEKGDIDQTDHYHDRKQGGGNTKRVYQWVG